MELGSSQYNYWDRRAPMGINIKQFLEDAAASIAEIKTISSGKTSCDISKKSDVEMWL